MKSQEVRYGMTQEEMQTEEQELLIRELSDFRRNRANEDTRREIEAYEKAALNEIPREKLDVFTLSLKTLAYIKRFNPEVYAEINQDLREGDRLATELRVGNQFGYNSDLTLGQILALNHDWVNLRRTISRVFSNLERITRNGDGRIKDHIALHAITLARESYEKEVRKSNLSAEDQIKVVDYSLLRDIDGVNRPISNFGLRMEY